ncbi:type IV pilin-like G/H family protein [Leptolyngbya sp. CCY15150]|uniref:type IV pilin-like G/H family protein n=1 Tax=Leptolyngbya sp. CCY15150 TaxID=2767772 RepID=UPI00194F709C|nr:type IV pilin-like G/H family protein [Leptolyngbya sp. CCY15150]
MTLPIRTQPRRSLLADSSPPTDAGFTMMELMVSIVIIGTLFVLAYPSFINQVSKARQSEAQSYIGAVNRAQQAHYLQHRRFGELPDLEVGIRTFTEHYTYTTEPEGVGMEAIAQTTATPTDNTIRGYLGKVWIGLAGGAGTTFTLMCEGSVGLVPVVEGTTCP